MTVTATDQRGNARPQSVRVVRIAVGSKRITLLGGNRQAAPVKSELPQALQISAIDAQGNPLANLPVRFDIVRGNGSISLQSGAPTKPNGVNPARNLVINTDNSGVAKIWLTLGSESSPGGNSVRAWSPEIAEDNICTATGTRGAPYWVLIDGNASAQFVQTNTAPVDALQSVVLDQNYNRMTATPVRYRILSGEAKFTATSAQNGTVSTDGQSITVNTDKDGRASVRPIAGETPGIVKIISEAVLPNNAVAGQALFQLSVLERKSGPTKFRGVVMNHTGKPLAGVRLSIARTNLSATSDSNGKFEFADQVPPGKIDLFVDGRTVTPTPNIEYPALHFETAIIPGQDNQLPHAIYLPPVNLSSSQIVGGNSDVTLTIPGYEGFELIVKTNSVTFPDGSHTGPIVVSPVHNDRLPMVPPGGAATFGTLGWTIQPTGTRFDPPAQVKIPNPGHMTAGQTAQIVQWDHDLAAFIPMGRGTVSEDASQIITDFGSGITKAGWGGCTGPACPPDPGFPQCTIRGPNSNCSDCEKARPVPPGACPTCEIDFLKEGRECENDPCKICRSGQCVPKFKSANIQSMTRFDFVNPEVVQTEEIPGFGQFVGNPEYARNGSDGDPPSYADWNVELQARCENEAWKFKVKKAVITPKIFLNSSIMNPLTVGDIAAANCPRTDVLEFGVRKGAGQGVKNISDIYECYEAAFSARGNFESGKIYIQKNMVEGHELVHFDRFKSEINAEVEEFVSFIEAIELAVLKNENPNDAEERFLSGDFYKQKVKEFAQIVTDRRGDPHKNPVDFYKAMMCSVTGHWCNLSHETG